MFLSVPQSVLNIISRIERKAAYLQGKGYGKATIEQEIKLALSLLDFCPTLAVDIGGNVGDYTAELRRRYGALEIHTFEPSAVNVEVLNNRFRGDSQIRIIPFAVSDAKGPAMLYADKPGSGLGSLTKRKLDHFDISFDATEAISVLRFEDYWSAELNGRHIDIVKIDIEGHELASLHGFGQALDATKMFQFEFGGANIDTRTYFQDFWYFFKEHSFEIFRITPIGLQSIPKYSEDDEFFSTTNYLAVNGRKL